MIKFAGHDLEANQKIVTEETKKYYPLSETQTKEPDQDQEI